MVSPQVTRPRTCRAQFQDWDGRINLEGQGHHDDASTNPSADVDGTMLEQGLPCSLCNGSSFRTACGRRSAETSTMHHCRAKMTPGLRMLAPVRRSPRARLPRIES